MATVLLAWELGAGQGHLRNLQMIARGLAQHGHRSVFAVRDLKTARAVFRGEPFPVLQSPFWHGRPSQGASSFMASSYADILAVRGFDRVDSLAAMVDAWQTLVDLVRPDLVVCDFSPTLCLAVYGALPNVIIGTGFALPPIEEPTFPRVLINAKPQMPQQALLEVVQQVQADRGKKVPPTLTSILTGERFVIVFPEIDPYRHLRRERCAGPIQTLPPLLSAPQKSIIFAYLSDARPIIQEMLIKLAEAGLTIETYIRDMTGPAKHRLRERGVNVHDQPQPMTDVLPRISLVVHHGGVGTAQLAMAAGRPQICWPQHLEQNLTAKAIQTLGLGTVVPPDPSATTISEIALSVAVNPRFGDQAMSQAARFRDQVIVNPLDAIVDRCLGLLA